jgi:phosphoribosylanthranilate isomerase
MKIKICGLRKLEDALLCERLGADALGFIFYKSSKRFIEPKYVTSITNRLSPFTAKIGVFVDHSVDEINIISSRAKLKVAQIHSINDDENLSNLALPYYKTYRVNNSFDFNELPTNEYFLLDSFIENEPGGTGVKFDWNLIPNNLLNKAIIAGGINENDLSILLNKIKPYGIDLSSSLEVENGNKSEIKIKSFFTKLHHLRS